MTTAITIYAIIALLLAVILQVGLDDAHRQKGHLVITAVLFCALWPLMPVFIALMKWDIRRMERKRDYHSERRPDEEAP